MSTARPNPPDAPTRKAVRAASPGRAAPPARPARQPRGRFVDGYLGYLLGQANHALFKDFEPRVRAAGLSSIEWRVLAVLHDGGPLAVSALAREVLSKQPTVTKLVQRMAAQGWVAAHACASDQRRTLVAITAAGRAVAQPLVAQARRHEARLLAGLSASDNAQLKSLLSRLALLDARP